MPAHGRCRSRSRPPGGRRAGPDPRAAADGGGACVLRGAGAVGHRRLGPGRRDGLHPTGRRPTATPALRRRPVRAGRPGRRPGGRGAPAVRRRDGEAGRRLDDRSGGRSGGRAPAGRWRVDPTGRTHARRYGRRHATAARGPGARPIARLTVLVGDVTGLVPADGDLGEGDQVALLEPRSLLLGIARASRYAGVDNPRLWATADVRAALEALSLQGRGPTVEELNGEGFPYSPYVLRRPELLAPANMAASAAAPAAVAGVRVSPGAAELPAPVREQPSPDAIAQAVAASAAAAQAAAGAPPVPTPPVASPTIAIPPASPAPTPPVAAVATPAPVQRDTVAIDGPDAPPS